MPNWKQHLVGLTKLHRQIFVYSLSNLNHRLYYSSMPKLYMVGPIIDNNNISVIVYGAVILIYGPI